jgi:hypothetical protein
MFLVKYKKNIKKKNKKIPQFIKILIITFFKKLNKFLIIILFEKIIIYI